LESKKQGSTAPQTSSGKERKKGDKEPKFLVQRDGRPEAKENIVERIAKFKEAGTGKSRLTGIIFERAGDVHHHQHDLSRQQGRKRTGGR